MVSQKVACVAVILRNPQGQALLQQRENNPNLSFAGYWTLPGGKVEDGETPQEAISREVMEEIELEASFHLWKVYERPGPSSITVVQHVYTGETGQTVSSFACNEGQALRYVGLEELAEIPLAYGFDALLTEYFTTQGFA